MIKTPKKRKAANPIAMAGKCKLNTADVARADEAALGVQYRPVLSKVPVPDPASHLAVAGYQGLSRD
jgi:hypothetical protein